MTDSTYYTLVFGVLLVLLFSSAVFYFYIRTNQSEEKISILESILLDLKMSIEIKSYTELPAENQVEQEQESSYPSFQEENEVALKEYNATDFMEMKDEVLDENQVEQEQEQEQKQEQQQKEQQQDEVEVSFLPMNEVLSDDVSYESMTHKELQSLAKSKGVSINGKKSQLILALKESDKLQSVKPGSSMWSGSFIETSSSVSDESE